jgi:hypothetical protein
MMPFLLDYPRRLIGGYLRGSGVSLLSQKMRGNNQLRETNRSLAYLFTKIEGVIRNAVWLPRLC